MGWGWGAPPDAGEPEGRAVFSGKRGTKLPSLPTSTRAEREAGKEACSPRAATAGRGGACNGAARQQRLPHRLAGAGRAVPPPSAAEVGGDAQVGASRCSFCCVLGCPAAPGKWPHFRRCFSVWDAEGCTRGEMRC